MTDPRLVTKGFRFFQISSLTWLLCGGLSAQSPQISFPSPPVEGETKVTVAIQGLPPAFKQGYIYCQIDGIAKKMKTKLPEPPAAPIAVDCNEKLVAGEKVGVNLSDSLPKGVRIQGPVQVVSPRMDGLGKVIVASGEGNVLTLAVSGITPPNPSQISVFDPSNKNITPRGTITLNRNGTFRVPVSAALKQGDQVSVMIGEMTWNALTIGGAAAADSSTSTSSDALISVTFVPDPKDSQTAITGFLKGDFATLGRVKKVYVEVLNGTEVVQGPLDGQLNPNGYGFNPANVKTLVEGQAVHVHVCGASQFVSFTGNTDGSKTIKNITVDMTPFEKGLPISGDGIPSGATIDTVDATNKSITMTQAATKTATSVSLQSSPIQTEHPCEQQSPPSTGSGAAAAAPLVEIAAKNANVTVTSLYDLGRAKAYFSVGAEFQGSNGSLGSASDFFALNADMNWWTSGPAQAPLCFLDLDKGADSDRGTFASQSREDLQAKDKGHESSYAAGNDCKHPFRFLVNTYAEAELTQIPLTTSSTSNNNSTTSPSADATQAALAAASTTTTGGGTPASSTFSLSSAKGAYVEGGIYTPFLPSFAQWSFRGQANSFFVAPMAKYAFLEPDSASTGSTTNFNLYRAYSGGLRLGQFRLPARFDKHGPELISYVDITAGKWENFRESNGTRGARVDVTGRYKIPYTVMYVGFDANMGPGGSDFRMFVGGRVDASSILGKLLPSTTSN